MSVRFSQLQKVFQLKSNLARAELWGDMQGYKVYLRWYYSDSTFTLQVYARPQNHENMTEVFQQWAEQHNRFALMRSWENRVTATLTMLKDDGPQTAVDEITALLTFLHEREFVPCCRLCGENKETFQYLANLDTTCVCKSCADFTARDIDRANKIIYDNTQSVGKGRAVLGCIFAAFLLFLMQLWAAGDIGNAYSILVMSALGILGIIMSLCVLRILKVKVSKGIAVLSTVLCVTASVAGITGWYARYFSKFNQETAEKYQLIYECAQSSDSLSEMIDNYYANGGDPYDDTLREFYNIDEEIYEKWVNGMELVVSNQSTADCLKNFRTLMMSSYGDKMRDGYRQLMISGSIATILYSVFIWRRIVKNDSSRFRFIKLDDIGKK